MRKLLVWALAGIFLVSTFGQNVVLAFTPNSVWPEVQKMQDLKIVNSIDKLDSAISYAVSATYVLRTKMMLDASFGLTPIYKNYTGNKVLDSTLNTLELFKVDFNKANPQKEISGTEFNILTKTFLGKEMETTAIPTKEEVVKNISKIYEGVKKDAFDKLEGKTDNTSEEDELNDLFKDLVNVLDGDDTSDLKKSELGRIAYKKLTDDTFAIAPKTVDFKFKDQNNTELKYANGVLTLDKKTTSVVVLKDGKPYDVIRDLKKSTDSTSSDIAEKGIKVTDDNFDWKIIYGVNTVAKMTVNWKNKLVVTTTGLFNSDDMGKITLVDEHYNRLRRWNIKHSDKYEYDFNTDKPKTFYLLAESKSNQSEFVVNLYSDSVSKDNLIATKRYDGVGHSKGNVQLNLNPNLTTLSSDIGLDDKVKVAFKLQNIDNSKVTLKKFYLKTKGNLEAKKAVITNDKGETFSNYEVTADSKGINVFLPDGKDGMTLSGSTTSELVLELSDFDGKENDDMTIEMPTRETDILFVNSDYPWKFAQYNGNPMTVGYGKYTLKKTSVLLNRIPQINDTVAIGTDVVLFKFFMQNVGEVRYSANKVILTPKGTTTATALEQGIRNLKLTYCEVKDSTVKSCDNNYNIIDKVSDFQVKSSGLEVSFDGDSTLKSGNYIFELRGDVNNNLDKDKMSFTAKAADFKVKNSEDDDIVVTGDVYSEELEVKKGDIDFTIHNDGIIDGVVNSDIKLATLTINNIGGVDTTLKSIDVKFLKVVSGSWIDSSDLLQLYLVDASQIKENTSLVSLNKIVSPITTTGKTSAKIKLTNPLTVKKGENVSLAIIGRIDGSNITSYPYQFRIKIPQNNIITTTSTGSQIKNKSDLFGLQMSILKSGELTVSTEIPSNNTKTKSIVSPSDKEILLAQINTEAESENIGLKKLVLKDNFTTPIGFNNLDSVSIYSKMKKDENDTTGLLKKVYIPSTESGALVNTITIDIPSNENGDNIIQKTDDVKTFYIYGIQNNTKNYKAGKTRLAIEKVEARGIDSGAKIDITSPSTSIENVNQKEITYYPAIPKIKLLTKNMSQKPWTNREVLEFEVLNDDSKDIRVNTLKLKISGTDGVSFANLLLKNKTNNKTVKEIATIPVGTRELNLENLKLKIKGNTGARLLLTADIYSTQDDGSLDVSFSYGNQDSSTEDYSVEYCALKDDGKECVDADFALPNKNLWFVRNMQNENNTVSIEILNYKNSAFLCTSADPVVNDGTPIDATVEDNGKMLLTIPVKNPADFTTEEDFNSTSVKLDTSLLKNGSGSILASSVDSIAYAGGNLNIRLNPSNTLGLSTSIEGKLKVKLQNKCGDYGTGKVITVNDANNVNYLTGIEIKEVWSPVATIFNVADINDEIVLKVTDPTMADNLKVMNKADFDKDAKSITLKKAGSTIMILQSEGLTIGSTIANVDIKTTVSANADGSKNVTIKRPEVASVDGPTLIVDTSKNLKVSFDALINDMKVVTSAVVNGLPYTTDSLDTTVWFTSNMN